MFIKSIFRIIHDEFKSGSGRYFDKLLMKASPPMSGIVESTELPTDEAVCGWNDPGIPALNKMQWSPEDGWIKGVLDLYQIALQ